MTDLILWSCDRGHKHATEAHAKECNRRARLGQMMPPDIEWPAPEERYLISVDPPSATISASAWRWAPSLGTADAPSPDDVQQMATYDGLGGGETAGDGGGEALS